MTIKSGFVVIEGEPLTVAIQHTSGTRGNVHMVLPVAPYGSGVGVVALFEAVNVCGVVE